MPSKAEELQKHIRSIADWPKKGILFRDITPLLAEPGAFADAVDALCLDFEERSVDYVASVEASGTDTLEVHSDAVGRGAKVLMVDDLLATGGTMAAACKLIEKIGGQIVGISFLIELAELAGREKLSGYKIKTVISY